MAVAAGYVTQAFGIIPKGKKTVEAGGERAVHEGDTEMSDIRVEEDS